MKNARWTIGFAGMVFMILVVGCENSNPPSTPALAKAAAAGDTIPSREEAAADPIFTTIDVPGASFTDAHDIGPTGDIVGRYASSDGKSHGYLLREGSFTTIDFSATFTDAFSINASGDIVGRYQTADGKFHGYLLSSAGTFTSLDFPGAAATGAFGINARGDVVGGYCYPAPCPPPAENANLGNHGFVLRGGTFSTIDVPDALLTQAWKINAAGQVTGRYKSPDGKWHAFVMSEGEFTPINVPGAIQTASFPASVGINAAGDVVGSYCATAPCPVRVADNLAVLH